jgi:hypothetical protein
MTGDGVYGIMTGEAVYYKYKGNGHSLKPNTIKMSLFKELNGHALDYDGHDVSDKMRIPMENVQQFVGITYGYPVRGVSIVLSTNNYTNIIFTQPSICDVSVWNTGHGPQSE